MSGCMDIDPIYVIDSDEEIEELYADPPLQLSQTQSGQVAPSTTQAGNRYASVASRESTISITSNCDQAQLSDELSLRSVVLPVSQTQTPAPFDAESSGSSYDSEDFEWSGHLRRCMQQVFEDQMLTPSLLSTCNAVLDSRDVIYAAVSKGHHRCTPYALASLFSSKMNAVIHFTRHEMESDMNVLQRYGLPSYYLSGLIERTSTEIEMKLKGAMLDRTAIFFVLAEDLTRSQSVYNSLHMAASLKKLERFVIPDAQALCQKNQASLSNLRKWFPSTPILAISSTTDMNTLANVSQKLGFSNFSTNIRSNTHSTEALCIVPSNRYISLIPLIPKISKIKRIANHIVNYIMTSRYLDKYGVIYCTKIEDTVALAGHLKNISGGLIETGICHCKMTMPQLHEVGQQWLEGKFKVLCRPMDSIPMKMDGRFERCDVRFTFHVAVPDNLKDLSKGIKRAGLDGYPSECYIFYRPIDVMSVISFLGPRANSSHHIAVQKMARWAYQIKHCRFLGIAKYLNDHSAQADDSSTNDEEVDLKKRCFNCDICQRPQDKLVVSKNMKTEVWRIIRIVREITGIDGRVAIRALSNIIRGVGRDEISYRTGNSSAVGTKTLQHPRYALGRSQLSNMEVDNLLLEMVFRGYLSYNFVRKPYTKGVVRWYPYIKLGPVGRNLSTAPDFEFMVLELSDSNAKDTSTGTRNVAVQHSNPLHIRTSEKRKRDNLDIPDAQASKTRAAKWREVIDLTSDDD